MEKILFFSKNLKTYLFAHDLKHDDIAAALGITPQAVGLWIKENRTPPIPTLTLLSSHIGIPLEALQWQDLTYKIIHDSNYSSVAEPDDKMYAMNSVVTRYRKHIEAVQVQLSQLVLDGTKVLEV